MRHRLWRRQEGEQRVRGGRPVLPQRAGSSPFPRGSRSRRDTVWGDAEGRAPGGPGVRSRCARSRGNRAGASRGGDTGPGRGRGERDHRQRPARGRRGGGARCARRSALGRRLLGPECGRRPPRSSPPSRPSYLPSPAPPSCPSAAAAARPERSPRLRVSGDAMYRLPWAVTTRAATPRGWAWGCGRRGAHHRAGPGLPRLGPGWAGGLGLGLGLALGVKLAGALRGAAPAPPPAAPDPEASPQAEQPPPRELPLAPRSAQTPTASSPGCYARAIDSSRDLLHRIKVLRRGRWRAGPRKGAPRGSSTRAEPTPVWATQGQLPSKTSRFPTVQPRADALGGLPNSGRRSLPALGTALPFLGCQPGTPLGLA